MSVRLTLTLTLTSTGGLRRGDRILTVGEKITYRPPRVVAAPLAPLEPGSPVCGVRLVNPNPESVTELVLYPSQVDGLQVVVERDHP